MSALALWLGLFFAVVWLVLITDRIAAALERIAQAQMSRAGLDEEGRET